MDDNRSECDCIYCKDMQEIQEFHDTGGYGNEVNDYGS